MITSITIGSITLNDSAYPLTGAKGLELPPVRLASYDLAGANFGRFVSSYFGRRRFSLEGLVIGADASDFLTKRAALIAILAGHTEQELVFTLSDGRVLRLLAVPTALDFPPQAGVPTAANFRAEFEAAIPVFEAATADTYQAGLPTGGGGAVPTAVPMSLGFGSGGSVFLTNAGDAPALPTVRLSGPVTNPAIRNNSTNEELRFTITLAGGEYLDLDFRAFTVTDQSGRNRYDTKGGDWWQLAPGITEVRFVADSTDASALATITVRSAYAGI